VAPNEVLVSHSGAANTTEGLLIVGHGTRDSAGQAELLQLASEMAHACPGRAVEASFLELAAPTIDSAVGRLAARGARRIVVAPLLLFAAGHARSDVPRAVQLAAQQHGCQIVRQAPHLGCHPELVELSALRGQEALGARPAEETLLLMVGRGSNEPSANSEMARFARLRWERQAFGWLEVCYTAMTRPRLEDALAVAARLPQRTVLVQPHLLFQGELLTRIRETVADCGRSHPEQEWLVAHHLGPDERVVRAALDRALEAVK
jgi:sirohydrochlorin cobaltochelatase